MIHNITAMTVREAIDLGRVDPNTKTANSWGSIWLTFDEAGQQIYKGRLPYCGTARVLIERGVDPEDILQGQTVEGLKTLVAKVGIFAGLTVAQRDPTKADQKAGRWTYKPEYWAKYRSAAEGE